MGSALLLIAVGVLLYFFVFAKKAVEEAIEEATTEEVTTTEEAPTMPAVEDEGDAEYQGEDVDDTPQGLESDDVYAWLAEREFTASDAQGLDADELRTLRNAIYARHGYIFKDEALTEYFSQYSWYEPISHDVTSQLNKTELKNVETIKRYEKGQGGKVTTSTTSTSTGGADIDALLNEYEKAVNAYLGLCRRAANGDATVYAAAQNWCNKYTSIAQRLGSRMSDMSPAQVNRFNRIARDAANAARF